MRGVLFGKGGATRAGHGGYSAVIRHSRIAPEGDRVLVKETVAVGENSGKNKARNSSTMIEHTVTFRLKHQPGSPGEAAFLGEAAELAAIPGVVDFLIRRQTSPKLDHTFGISMWFATRADYEAYNAHPAHLAFLEKRWFSEVESFQEADFEPL